MARPNAGIPMVGADNVSHVPSTFSAIRTSEINVIFTTLQGTTAAMRVAASLSRATEARVRLIDPRILRYPLRSAGYALAAAPEVSIEDRERERVVRAAGVPVEVLVYNCGRETDAIRVALRRHSFVIMGGHRSWLPTRQERLQRAIESMGHIVTFVNEREL